MPIHEHFQWMLARHEASAIADSDPLHLSGQRTYDLIEWEVHQVLGVAPFSVAGVHALAETGAPHYTKIPSAP